MFIQLIQCLYSSFNVYTASFNVYTAHSMFIQLSFNVYTAHSMFIQLA